MPETAESSRNAITKLVVANKAGELNNWHDFLHSFIKRAVNVYSARPGGLAWQVVTDNFMRLQLGTMIFDYGGDEKDPEWNEWDLPHRPKPLTDAQLTSKKAVTLHDVQERKFKNYYDALTTLTQDLTAALSEQIQKDIAGKDIDFHRLSLTEVSNRLIAKYGTTSSGDMDTWLSETRTLLDDQYNIISHCSMITRAFGLLARASQPFPEYAMVTALIDSIKHHSAFDAVIRDFTKTPALRQKIDTLITDLETFHKSNQGTVKASKLFIAAPAIARDTTASPTSVMQLDFNDQLALAFAAGAKSVAVVPVAPNPNKDKGRNPNKGMYCFTCGDGNHMSLACRRPNEAHLAHLSRHSNHPGKSTPGCATTSHPPRVHAK